jgi:hypothetical protein
MADQAQPVAIWKRVLALLLDFLTAFFVFGSLIASVTGEMTEDGFRLEGSSSLLLAVLVMAYFYGARYFAGGTLWDWILGIRRPPSR